MKNLRIGSATLCWLLFVFCMTEASKFSSNERDSSNNPQCGSKDTLPPFSTQCTLNSYIDDSTRMRQFEVSYPSIAEVTSKSEQVIDSSTDVFYQFAYVHIVVGTPSPYLSISLRKSCAFVLNSEVQFHSRVDKSSASTHLTAILPPCADSNDALCTYYIVVQASDAGIDYFTDAGVGQDFEDSSPSSEKNRKTPLDLKHLNGDLSVEDEANDDDNQQRHHHHDDDSHVSTSTSIEDKPHRVEFSIRQQIGILLEFNDKLLFEPSVAQIDYFDSHNGGADDDHSDYGAWLSAGTLSVSIAADCMSSILMTAIGSVSKMQIGVVRVYSFARFHFEQLLYYLLNGSPTHTLRVSDRVVEPLHVNVDANLRNMPQKNHNQNEEEEDIEENPIANKIADTFGKKSEVDDVNANTNKNITATEEPSSVQCNYQQLYGVRASSSDFPVGLIFQRVDHTFSDIPGTNEQKVKVTISRFTSRPYPLASAKTDSSSDNGQGMTSTLGRPRKWRSPRDQLLFSVAARELEYQVYVQPNLTAIQKLVMNGAGWFLFLMCVTLMAVAVCRRRGTARRRRKGYCCCGICCIRYPSAVSRLFTKCKRKCIAVLRTVGVGHGHVGEDEDVDVNGEEVESESSGSDDELRLDFAQFVNSLRQSAALASESAVSEGVLSFGFGQPVVGASNEQINALPLEVFGARHKRSKYRCKNSTCSICLDTYVLGEKIRKLKCSHLFHQRCVDPWLRLKSFCPLCKQRIDDAIDVHLETSTAKSLSSASASDSSVWDAHRIAGGGQRRQSFVLVLEPTVEAEEKEKEECDDLHEFCCHLDLNLKDENEDTPALVCAQRRDTGTSSIRNSPTASALAEEALRVATIAKAVADASAKTQSGGRIRKPIRFSPLAALKRRFSKKFSSEVEEGDDGRAVESEEKEDGPIETATAPCSPCMGPLERRSLEMSPKSKSGFKHITIDMKESDDFSRYNERMQQSHALSETDANLFDDCDWLDADGSGNMTSAKSAIRFRRAAKCGDLVEQRLATDSSTLRSAAVAAVVSAHNSSGPQWNRRVSLQRSRVRRQQHVGTHLFGSFQSLTPPVSASLDTQQKSKNL